MLTFAKTSYKQPEAVGEFELLPRQSHKEPIGASVLLQGQVARWWR